MSKNILLCCLIVSILAMVPSAFAGKVELTTYYPAPYGEYKEIKTTEKADFATSSGAVNVGSTTNHTVLVVDNVLTLAPVAISPGDASGAEGSLCYSTNAGGAGVGGILYRNGTSWQSFAGSSVVAEKTINHPSVGSGFSGTQIFTNTDTFNLATKSLVFFSALMGSDHPGTSGADKVTITIDGVLYGANSPQGDVNFSDTIAGFAVLNAGNHTITMTQNTGGGSLPWTLRYSQLKYVVLKY